MSALSGRDLLLKINTDGQFTTCAGLRTKSFTLNARPIDVTDTGSGGWRDLLPGAGLRSAEIAGAGIFRDAQSDSQIRSAFFEQSALLCAFHMPGFGVLKGEFLVTRLRYLGSYDGAASYELAFQSGGRLVFEAEK